MELIIALGWDEIESRAAIQPFSSICRDAEHMVWVLYLLSVHSLLLCFLRVSQVCLCHLMRNSLGPSDPTTAPALPPSFPPTLPSFQECAHHVAHRQKSYSIDCKDIVSKHLASLMQIFERCTLTVPRPATTAETRVLCLLSLSDSGSKQGCSHSPASKLVFTS